VNIAVFSTKGYEQRSFERVNREFDHILTFFDTRLTADTASLARGFEGVCVFVNDEVDAAAIEEMARGGTRIVATRSAGYNHIDLEAAAATGIRVVRVPAYSPNAVSEFTIGLILTLGRQIHRAYNRVRDNNFELEGLQGFELGDKTVGVFGTGRIGAAVIRNLSGFGCRILAYDVYRNPDVTGLAEYLDDPQEIARRADILTLHMPLTPDTHHIINADTVDRMKHGVFIVNTSRGALLDTAAIIDALKTGKIGFLAIDVYEVEDSLFFRDLSNEIVTDDVFARLLTFPNVLVTGHQAFLTDKALRNIAETTLGNLAEYEADGRCENEVTVEKISPE
jgi:D-lactate dehydrogenase